MGKKENWLVSVKKAFSPETKEKKKEKSGKKSKNKWALGKSKRPEISEAADPLEEPMMVGTKAAELTELEDEQNKHASSVAITTAVAAQAAVPDAQDAAEVVRLTVVPQPSGKSKEELASIKIQTAFRGYLARRSLRALRGLVRLKTLIHGNSVKRQAATSLRCMRTLSRVQTQIRSRRLRMSEENQALQRQIQLKREKELEDLKAAMGEDWDDSLQSKEQIESRLANKVEAAVRRERALAYTFSHQQQWRNSSKSANTMFVDPNNPHWGWSWLERWMAARPWESRSVVDKENSDASSVKTVTRGAGEVTKPTTPHGLNGERPSPLTVKPVRPSSRVSPSALPPKSSSATNKTKFTSPHEGQLSQEESRNTVNVQSERTRRHSIAASSIRDDESLASSPSIPSYMTPTESARNKARLSSPLGDKPESTEKTPTSFLAKKLLSFPSAEKSNGTASPVSTARFAVSGGENIPKDVTVSS